MLFYLCGHNYGCTNNNSLSNENKNLINSIKIFGIVLFGIEYLISFLISSIVWLKYTSYLSLNGWKYSIKYYLFSIVIHPMVNVFEFEPFIGWLLRGIVYYFGCLICKFTIFGFIFQRSICVVFGNKRKDSSTPQYKKCLKFINNLFNHSKDHQLKIFYSIIYHVFYYILLLVVFGIMKKYY